MTKAPKSNSDSGGSGTPLTFVSPEFDERKYSLVSQAARLRDLRLEKGDFSADLKALFQLQEGEEEFIEQSFSGESGEKEFSRETGLLIGAYKWQAEVKVRRRRVLRVRATYRVFYQNLVDADPDYAAVYFEKVARFATYPYFRANFAIHASAAGVMLAPLPSLNERVD